MSSAFKRKPEHVLAAIMPGGGKPIEVRQLPEPLLEPDSGVLDVHLSEVCGTQVRFSHDGRPDVNDHFRTSSFCWAMYLRLLRRHVEFGETVPYERRLDA